MKGEDVEKDKRIDDALAMLAICEKRIAALQEQLACTQAELHCAEIGMDMRQSGKIGIDGVRWVGNASRGVYEVVREAVLKTLRGDE